MAHNTVATATTASTRSQYWMGEWCLMLWLWTLNIIAPVFANPIEEARLTEQLESELGQGELLSLETGERTFYAVLDISRLPTRQGAVVLLSEAGFRSDAGIIGTLRHILPQHGWTTLSLQLPVLESEAKPSDYLALVPQASSRIEAAIAYLKGRLVQNIAMAGHGFGGLATLRYLAEKKSSPVRALILLSPWWPKSLEKSLQNWLNATALPVLDVRGEYDERRILQTALDRHLILKGRPGYRQLRLSGVGHHYHGRETVLAKRIYGWLQLVTRGEGAR